MPPGTKPEVFAPGVISTEQEHEFGSVFSSDGDEFFYGVDVGDRTEIRYTRLEDNTWTLPVIIISDSVYGFNDPFLSPDEKELYYISDKPMEGFGESVPHDIWFSRRTEGNTWSDPINAGPNINSEAAEYYISFTSDKTMFFASNIASSTTWWRNFDIYYSTFDKGEFQEPVRLGAAVNTDEYEADVFVSPDASYLIFCGMREEGYGNGDLYISFAQPDGEWSQAVNMGPEVNSEAHELCPFVTLDGKYLLYTRGGDIYWVSTEIIDNYRN